MYAHYIFVTVNRWADDKFGTHVSLLDLVASEGGNAAAR